MSINVERLGDGVAVRETRGDAVIVLSERAKAAIHVDGGFTKPRAHGLIDHAVEAAVLQLWRALAWCRMSEIRALPDHLLVPRGTGGPHTFRVPGAPGPLRQT